MRPYIALFVLLITNVLFSQTFHDTQGKLEISGSGQATYTVPIAMPPSLKNVGPIINLVYSSGQLGGIAGQGWNIGTISNISRIATRADIDGYIDGVDFDSNDMLALDGQRLILKSGSYWASGSVYQTEVQSNTKIELQGSGTAMYFIVTAPDGSRSWYGNYQEMDATDLTAFYIVRFEDALGNYMTYHYTKPFNASLCISEIKFSANVNGLAPLNLIRFNYQAAKRKETTYIKGIAHEKAALLKSVEVKTGDQLFREYRLAYISDLQLGYEKMANIQEYNGAGEAANPIAFEYENTQTVIEGSEYNTTYFNNLNFSEIKLSGDFDGDGRLDFATEEKMYTNLFLNQSATVTDISFANQGKRFVVQTLNQNKLNQFQSIAYVKEELQSVDFKIYELNVGNFVNTYTKTIAMDNEVNCVSNCPTNPCGNNNTYSQMRGTNQYLEGDFNGDGISEVLIFTFDQNRTYNYESYTIPEPGGPEPEIIIDPIEGGVPGETYWQCVQRFTAEQEYSTISIVDLNPNSPSAFNTRGYSAFPTTLLEGFGQNTNTKKYVADFNGDGKAEILFINHYGNYKVIGIKQLNSAPWSQMELLGNGTILGYHSDKQLLLGDFNGDGKADFIVPDSRGGEHHTLWHIYYSNPRPSGGEFFEKESHNIVEYWPDTGGRYDTQRHFSSYYALDTNNDGKSDIVRVWRKHYKPDWTINDHDTQWRVSTYANNIGNTTITGEKFTLDYSSAHNHNSDSPEVPTPVVAPFKYRSLNRDLVIVRNHHNQLTFVDFKKDVTKNTLLKKVMASAGNIVDEISYSTMEPVSVFSSGLGTLNEFYSSRNSVTYPHVEIKRLPDNYLVSQIKNSIDGVIRYQDFRYHGLVVNMQGLGMIGFNKTARSMWYHTPSAKRTWSVFESDPLLRGGLKRSYTDLVQTGNDFSFVASGNPSGIINSTVNEYVHQTINNVYIAYLSRQITTDFTTGVINEVSHTYEPLYVLPVATTSKNFLNNVLQGTTTTTNVFENNPSGAASDYYIGRPISTETVVSAYSDVVKRSQSYQYANNRLIKTLKKGNTDEAKYLVEEFEYDNLGNLKKRIISSQGYPSPFIAPRSTEYTYDPTGRFIKTVKDPEGLISTNNTYHPLYGTVLSSTNPYNETTLMVLDNWGKVKTQTDHFGKITTHSYLKESNEFVVNITGEDGSHSWLRLDALGRTKRTGVKNIDNTYSIKGFEYDYLGRKYKESEPSSSSILSQWNISFFDDYNRTVQIISATGLTTNITYSGLTVTASDGTKTTSSTKNANGDVVSATDGGGTINYTYYANGNVKDTNYEGTTISMRYNEWGMKTVLSDPSAGIYRYAYYPTGELRSEATPKGATIYELGPQGKLQSKSIEGDLISQTIEYTYDPTTKMLTRESMLDNGNGYSNTIEYYYENNELAKVTETTPEAQYEKEYRYDGFGRVSNESTLAKHLQTGKSSGRQVSNSYKNGYHWQIVDDKEGKVIWQANSVDARGQLTGGALGNGISIAKSYDAFGFPTQFKDDRANGQNIMTLNTVFDPQRGNLTSRYNSLFDRYENFEYDSLDRLTFFTNSRGDQEEQKYDNRGRITSNDLGRYGYDENKAYQNTSIELTEQSKAYYGNREGLFNDNMEGQAGWTDNYGNNTISYDNNKHLTGKYSLKIANASSSEVMTFSETRISVDNAQDTEYTYSVWVYTDGAEAEMFLYMGTENTQSSFVAYDNILTTESGLWVKVEQTVLVPAAIKYLSLRLDNNGGGNVWFDDARISRTGEVPTGLRELNISYNALKSPVEIVETDVDKISFRYNIGGNRSLMYYGGNQDEPGERAYRKNYSSSGQMEIQYNTRTHAVEFTTFIGGDAYSAPAMVKSDGEKQKYFYLHRDYLGSIVAITDEEGNLAEKRLFDAWGNIVKVQDGAGNDLARLTLLDRGFTGHEHLQSVGLVHMNGRLYDPKLHRFLQPDNFVQDPHNTQSYNRYGYVWNNPLRFTDPSGELVFEAIAIGALIAATTYTMTALLADVPFTAGGLIQATFIGALSGAVTFGIGDIASNICQFGTRLTFQALAHGSFQGLVSGVQGGSFLTSFASGSIGSIVSSLWTGGYMNSADSYWGGLGGSWAGSDFGTIAFGTVSGGAGAALTKGNFWQGAASGLVVSGLNHYLHKMQDDPLSILAREIAETFGLKNAEDVRKFLKEHPIVEQNGIVKFKGIEDVSIDINVQGPSNLQQLGEKGGKIGLNYGLKKGLVSIFGKAAGSILTDGGMGKIPQPGDQKMAAMRKADRYNKAADQLIEYMFRPQGPMVEPNFGNRWIPYTGKNRYETKYRFWPR